MVVLPFVLSLLSKYSFRLVIKRKNWLRGSSFMLYQLQQHQNEPYLVILLRYELTAYFRSFFLLMKSSNSHFAIIVQNNSTQALCKTIVLKHSKIYCFALNNFSGLCKGWKDNCFHTDKTRC